MGEIIDRRNTLTEYYRKTLNAKPNPLLLEALNHTEGRDLAYDLGCGAGRDTRLLAQHFRRVIAIDQAEESIGLVRQLSLPEVHIQAMLLQNVTFENSDLINAQKVLMFIPTGNLPFIFLRMEHALKLGGVFVGTFTGRNDWRNRDQPLGITTHTEEELREAFTQLEIIKFNEYERMGMTVLGERYFHTIELIAQKT